MINGFDKYTEPLSPYEESLIPIVIKGFEYHKGVKNVIANKEIVRKMKENGYDVSGPRIRKIINHIRAKSLAPIVASSKGYWYSENVNEIKEHIQSLRDRSSGIISAANGLRIYIENQYQQQKLL